MNKQSLSTARWVLSALGDTPIEIPDDLTATVPGSVHTVLTERALIGDVWHGQNENLQHWVGQTPWRFATELPEPAPGERVELVCDGLDTVATVRLGDVVVGETANMHRRHRFDVTAALATSRELTIDFAAPTVEANRRASELGPRPNAYPTPFNALRKMACSFGWDWGASTATSGIWRDIRLESWSTARFDQVLTDARPTADGGQVTVRVAVERTREADLTVVAELGEHRAEATIPAGEREVEFVLDAPGVQRWWPVGHGDAVLYPLTVTLLAEGEELDRLERKVGFRSVEWRTDADDFGTRFDLYVNDELVEVHGVNWIPDHTDVATISRDRLRERLEQALAAHCNLIRVWGGGTYESEDFYDLCDELGLLVWQDFTLACAAYAEEEPLYSEFVAEARDNVARLGHRASLVLWNGNNENVWGHHDWAWELPLDGATWGLGYYTEVFPKVVAELAPTSWYSPGSPWSPTGDGIEMQPDLSPNDERHGTMHVWDAWNQRPMTAYRDYSPHFVAEFGWQGPPTWTTMQDFEDEALTPTSPGTLVHQKAFGGNDKLTVGAVPNLKVPAEIEAWHWAMQWNQAEAMRVGIGWYRSLFPRCTGTILWQINDCWPVVSWAAVDSYGRPKPLFHVLREVQTPRWLTIQPVDGQDPEAGLRATLVNDTPDAVDTTVVVRRLNYLGEELDRLEAPLHADARGAATVDLSGLSTPQDAASELLVAEADGMRAWWWFATPRNSALEEARVRVSVMGSQVRVEAENLVRDLTMLIDKANPDARVLDGMVSLLPGESFTFTVDGEVDAKGVERALACVNQLVVR